MEWVLKICDLSREWKSKGVIDAETDGILESNGPSTLYNALYNPLYCNRLYNGLQSVDIRAAGCKV